MNIIRLLVTEIGRLNIVTVVNLDDILDAGWVKSIVPRDQYVCNNEELIRIIHRLSKEYRLLITDSVVSMRELEK